MTPFKIGNIEKKKGMEPVKRVLLKSSPFVFNAADWEDTPPKKTKKDGKKVVTAKQDIVKQNFKFGKGDTIPSKSKDELGPRKIQRFTLADMYDDDSSFKIRNIEKQKAMEPVKRVLPKSSPFVYNAADFEDSPPKKMKKDGKKVVTTKQDIVQRKTFGKVDTVRSKYAPVPKTGAVPKQLFCAHKNKYMLRPLPQMKPTKKSAELNNTQPLLSMGDVENDLIKSSRIFVQRMEQDDPVKEVGTAVLQFPQKSQLSELKNTTETHRNNVKPVSPMITKPDIINYTLNTSQSLSISSFGGLSTTDIVTQKNISSDEEEAEFLQNEKKINVEELNKVLYKTHENFEQLKVKQRNLHQKFKTFANLFAEEMELFQIQIENYETNYIEDVTKILASLKNGTKFEKGEEWKVSIDHAARVSKNIPTAKRNVTFNLKAEKEVSNISLNDNGLEKSVYLYNSIRKGYQNLLNTPKFNRTGLQTPKSQRTNKRDSISRKIQKQCLLLLDTPNKNKK